MNLRIYLKHGEGVVEVQGLSKKSFKGIIVSILDGTPFELCDLDGNTTHVFARNAVAWAETFEDDENAI